NSVYDKFRCRLLLYKTLSVGLRNKADEIQKIIEIIKKEAYPNYETIHENIVSILPFSNEVVQVTPPRMEQNLLLYFINKIWKKLKGEF
ncbi:hypothetical protein ABH296_10730, partial [Acinetobacter pittii]